MKIEEELFQKTLLQGEKILEEIFKNSKDNVINGADAFKLYDTYGYPIELTELPLIPLSYRDFTSSINPLDIILSTLSSIL